MTDATTLVIERVIAATPERVFRAWTESGELARWFGPENFSTRVVENHVEPDGRYAFVMTSPDAEEFELSGQYREIVPPTKLVMTWKWSTDDYDTLVTVEFRADAQNTLLRLTHEGFPGADEVTRHDQGWTSTINDLERHLAS